MNKIGCLTLCLSLFSFHIAFAETYSTESRAIKSVTTTYKANPKAADFLEAIKPQIPKGLYSEMKRHLKNLDDGLLPKISSDGDTLTISGKKNTLIFLKVISATKQIFSINGKVLDFSLVKNMGQRYQMIEDAIPRTYGKNIHFNLSQNSAIADDSSNLLRIGGPIGIGAAFTVFAVGGPMSKWGWAILAVSWVIWNDGICDDIGKQRETCFFQRKILETKIKKDKNFSDAMDSRVRPDCSKHETSSEETETMNNLKNLVHDVDEEQRALAMCLDNKQKDLLQCTQDYSMLSFYSCLYIPKGLTGHLRPWAKKVLETSGDTTTPKRVN